MFSVQSSVFFWLKNSALRTLSINGRSWDQFFNRIELWRNCRDNPPTYTSNTMCLVSIATLQYNPTKKDDIWKWAKITSRHRGEHRSTFCSQYVFCMFLQKQTAVLWKQCKKTGDHYQQYSCHPIVESFSEQLILSSKRLSWSVGVRGWRPLHVF